MTSNAIKLPPERAIQLRTLADARGVSVTEMVGALINREIKAGRLADGVPGFTVKPTRSGLSYDFTIGDFVVPRLSIAELRELADTVERVATTKGDSGKIVDIRSTRLAVARIGTGLRIIAENLDTGNRVKRAFPPDVALDLARQLRNAVKG